MSKTVKTYFTLADHQRGWPHSTWIWSPSALFVC